MGKTASQHAAEQRIHVLGLQEHHYKAQGRDPGAIPRAHDKLEVGTKWMRGQKWSMVGNLSLTPKSGVLIMWLHDPAPRRKQ